MNVAVSVHEAPPFGAESPEDEGREVHLVEVHDAWGSFLCRVFLQPAEGGCHVQVDTEPAPEDEVQAASLRIASMPNAVLVGVRAPERLPRGHVESQIS